MSEGLISRRPATDIVQGSGVVLGIRPVDSFIRVWRALGHGGFVVRRLATASGATATAEGPENTGDERASDGEPHVDEHGGADVEGDAVLLESDVESATEADICGGRKDGKGPEEDGGDHACQGSEERTEAGEETANADEDLDGCGDDGDDVESRNPLRGCLSVPGEGVLQVFVEEVIGHCTVQAPDSGGIEGEVELFGGAEINRASGTLPDCKN